MDNRVKQKMMEVLALMTLAITSRRLYPPKNPMVINAIDSLYQSMKELLKKEDSLIFAEADKNLLIYDVPLSKSEQKQPKIAALLELLIDFGIKSVTIAPEVTRNDLSLFLDILSQTPEAISSSGGINKVMAERKVGHILLGQKVYIARTSQNRILASIDIPDDDIIQFIAGANPQAGPDLDQVRKMARDSDWLGQIFKSGMDQIKDNRNLPNSQSSENIVRMMSMLDRVVDKSDQEKVSHLIAKSIADLNAEMIGHILSQDIDHYFNGKLLPDILAQLEGGKIDRVMDIVRNELKKSKPLPGSDKEKTLQQIIEAGEGKKGKDIFNRKEEITPVLSGQEEMILNTSLQDTLAAVVDDLNLPGPPETVESLTDRLAEALLNDRQDIRDKVSAALARVIEPLPKEHQLTLMERLAPTLMRWIQLETSATAAHKKISTLLKDHMLNLIQEHKYAACLPLLNAFHLIDQGLLEKNEEIRMTATEVIHELSQWYRLDFLFEAYVKSYDQEKMDIGRILARLGKASLHRLMDMLRDHPDSDERVRILHLIKEIGPAALPVITERSLKDFPWYHQRNLAYLLRFIKSNTTVEVLQKLLRHKHQKVREEALESLYLAGETERGPVLLSLLPTADDSFKMDIIEMLGKLRYKEAATVLIEMLKDRPLLASVARKDLEEVICLALGKIGTPEAAALLTEISKQKFYRINSYSEKVRRAAARALMSINA